MSKDQPVSSSSYNPTPAGPTYPTALVPQVRIRHPELGMAVVTATDGRTVTVRFDTGQTLTLNPKSVKLDRIHWPMGQAVLIQSTNQVGIVRGVRVEDNICYYRIQLVGTEQTLVIAESLLSDALGLEDPSDMLIAGKFADPKLFYLRTMGNYLACAGRSLGASRIAARILPKAHQIFVTDRVVSAPRVRFLLADEVGLGKTIEAGLIIQELRTRGGLDRVLILTPPNLVLQWLYELTQKFNERFKWYDSQRVKEEQSRNPGENIWDIGRNIICSQQYVASHPELWNEIAQVPWDLVIFDEAHHVRRQLAGGNRVTSTDLYKFASQLSLRTRGLLLLTATPMQLQPYELYSMVELLDPALFYSYEFFETEREKNIAVNSAIKRLIEIEDLDADGRTDLLSDLSLLLKMPQALLQTLFVSQVDRDRVIEELTSKHLLSEVMIRNRKRLVGGFTQRIPHIINVEYSGNERRLYDSVQKYVRSVYSRLDPGKRTFYGFMLASYQKRLTSSVYAFRLSIERRLEKLRAREMVSVSTLVRTMDPQELTDSDLDDFMKSLGDSVAFATSGKEVQAEVDGLTALLIQARNITTDSKLQSLLGFLAKLFKEYPDKQVLIFTQFTDTLQFLEEALASRWPVTVFHGKMNPKDKDAAIGHFQRGDAQILICTEAGGEGRNLQFCSVLVNYDLPYNPMKVEQRIGRLDRIGQTSDVHIYSFAIAGTVEERVLDVLDKRIHAFEETIGGLDPILGQMELDIQKIVLESDPSQLNRSLNKYADHVQAEVTRARKAEETLRDFAIELRSYGRDNSTSFDAAEQDRLTKHSNKWSKALLKYIDATIRPLGSDAFSVKLGRRMRVDLPDLTRDTYQITFNYQQALQDGLVEYGSFGHPLFDALIEYITSENFTEGMTANRTVESKEFAGFHGFQFNFLVTIQSLYERQRVVPIVMDVNGRQHPELTSLVLDNYDWQSKQTSRDPSALPRWRSAVEHARDAATAIIERQLEDEVNLLKALSQESYEAERRKLEQYCTYRETEGLRKLEHTEKILESLRALVDEQERRIIPIWQRNLENAQIYLQALQSDRVNMLKDLEKRLDISYAYELISAAWLAIVPPTDVQAPAE